MRGTLPILIGGGGEKVTLRLVAQHADIWNAFGAPEDFAAQERDPRRWCAKVGRDPAEIERSVTVQDAHADRIDDFAKAGATLLVAGINGPDYDLSLVQRLIAAATPSRRPSR